MDSRKEDQNKVRFLNRAPEADVRTPGQFADVGGAAPAPALQRPEAHLAPPAYQSPLPVRRGGDSSIKIQKSIVALAQQDDTDALSTIFGQFIPSDEKIVWVGYLGHLGLLFGKKSFACLTDKRIADVSIGWFGEVIYQDALLEYFNSTVVYQPSRLGLYVVSVITMLFLAYQTWNVFEMMQAGSYGVIWYVLLFPVAIVVSFLILEFIIHAYYRIMKCGVVLWIKDGVSIYMFADRKLLTKANGMVRLVRQLRDERISALGHIG